MDLSVLQPLGSVAGAAIAVWGIMASSRKTICDKIDAVNAASESRASKTWDGIKELRDHAEKTYARQDVVEARLDVVKTKRCPDCPLNQRVVS